MMNWLKVPLGGINKAEQGTCKSFSNELGMTIAPESLEMIIKTRGLLN